MNGPWHPSPSPQQQTQQEKSNGPSSPASTQGVLVQMFEQLRSGVLIQCVRELGDGG